MGGLPRSAQAYIVSLALGSAVAATWAVTRLPGDPDGVFSVVLFAAAACGAQLFPIALPGVRAELTVATAITIAAATTLGPAAAVWVALVSTAFRGVALRRPWHKIVFNASQLSIAYGAAALAYHSVWTGAPLANVWPAIPAAAALGAVYIAFNTALVYLIISLVERTPFLRLWRLSAQRVLVYDVVMVAVGLVFSILWTYNRWSIPLVIPLALALYQSMAAVGKMERQTKHALLALARVIDQRDCQTFAHSEQVAEYVAWICEQLGLPSDETEVIVFAARLHDLGKVGVPDGLLLKPDKLTAEEESQFRRHPDIGADIIAQFPIFKEGTEIVRHEHEWYNGEGYPKGLRGDDIPLGSRLIAVADAYEAMTSDRPYRKALSQDEAVERLLAGAGSQFDSVAVHAFLAALRKHKGIPLAAPETKVAGPTVDRRLAKLGATIEDAGATPPIVKA